VHVLTYAGYILGFPSDTPESIERDIKIIHRELPIDILGCRSPTALRRFRKSMQQHDRLSGSMLLVVHPNVGCLDNLS
jgi:hypothetical protein